MTEFDYLDLCFDKWAALPVTDLTRTQQIVVDVNSALGVVSGNGFQNFWSAYEDESERIIESFRLANLSDLADVLEKTRFLLDEIKHCTNYEEVLRIVDAHEDKLNPLFRVFTSKEPDAREALLQFFTTEVQLTNSVRRTGGAADARRFGDSAVRR